MAVLVMNGGHWLALQSVAWGRMILVFSQHESLTMALAKTFDGQHPCPLCLKIKDGWKQQKQQEEKMPWVKTEQLPEGFWEFRCFSLPATPTVPVHDGAFVAEYCYDFSDSPPTPPPRA